MNLPSISRSVIVAMATLVIACNSAYAEKPEKGNGNGNGNSGKNKSEQQHKRGGGPDQGGKKADKGTGKNSETSNVSVSFNFGRSETSIVRDYYGGQVAKGKCPPGLAKKGNGCQPPGQAKQWQKGRALGSDVRYYDIPNELRIRLPVPPLNHKYVQLGTDLLLIAVGTAIVVDAVDGIF
ncbi:MAG: RcnB family protein [Gammaproteobacteria bacterium]|nr:RcnB family protein [Gammaproteobacteria bacterium]MBU1528641.1 RcnB family protein [Gammaproteobacteria bacterium]